MYIQQHMPWKVIIGQYEKLYFHGLIFFQLKNRNIVQTSVDVFISGHVKEETFRIWTL